MESAEHYIAERSQTRAAKREHSYAPLFFLYTVLTILGGESCIFHGKHYSGITSQCYKEFGDIDGSTASTTDCALCQNWYQAYAYGFFPRPGANTDRRYPFIVVE